VADSFTLVTDGEAKAQIVIGDGPPETVRFAAKELRAFVAKMSTAGLYASQKKDCEGLLSRL
jgi:hypothetical protein